MNAADVLLSVQIQIIAVCLGLSLGLLPSTIRSSRERRRRQREEPIRALERRVAKLERRVSRALVDRVA